MENVPGKVIQEFGRLAKVYGVAFQPTANGFTLSGLIDSILNLRAEVDAQLLWKTPRKIPVQPADPSLSLQPAGHTRDPTTAPTRATLAPPLEIPPHVLSRSFSDPSTLGGHNPPIAVSSGPRFDPASPLCPPVLRAAAGHATSGHTGPSTHGEYVMPSTVPPSLPEPTTLTTVGYPSGALPIASHLPKSGRHLPIAEKPSPEHDLHPVVHNPDDPSSSGRENDPPTDGARKGYPPGDKGVGSDTAHTGVTSSSPPPLSPDMAADDASAKESPNVFTNLNPDALALVQRLQERDVPGIEYNIGEGSVHFRLEGESEIETAITKFQEAYKKVAAHGRRLRAENVAIPPTCTKEEVETEIATFEQKYLSTAFVLDEAKRMVRVISQARQFDQAKQFLEEALQKLSKALRTTPAAPAAVAGEITISFSQNRTLTLRRGNIVKEKADILVNAANGSLIHGSGVAGALNEASERKLQIHCNKYMETKQRGKEIPVGEVAVTHAGGKLACDRVIHAVGPDGFTHSPAQCEHLVTQVIRNTLKTAERYNAVSIVLPAISCGIFDVSKDLVARCIIDTVLGFSYNKPAPTLSDIRIVILDGPTYSCFAHYIAQPHKNGAGKSASFPHKPHPQKPLKNTEEKPLAVEGELRATEATTQILCSDFLSIGVSLCLDDMDWIMPLLRKAAPKWKKILMKIGLRNEDIMSTTKDEAVLLHMGMGRWLRQKQARATLDTLISALCSPEVGESDVASEILTSKFQGCFCYNYLKVCFYSLFSEIRQQPFRCKVSYAS